MSPPDLVSAGVRPSAPRTRRGPHVRTLFVVGACVLAAIVPLILFAGLWLRNEMNDGQRDFQRMMQARAVALSLRLDGAVREQITLLRALSTLPTLDGLDVPAFHERAERILREVPAWRSLVLIDPVAGREIAGAGRALSADPVVLSDPAPARSAASTRGPVISTVNSGGASGTIRVHVPVVREGAASLVVAADLRAEHVRDIAAAEIRPDSLSALVLDASGRLLVRTRGPDPAAGEVADTAVAGRIAGRDGGLFAVRTDDGRDLLVAFRRSAVTGWASLVSADRHKLDVLADRSTWTTIAAGLLSLLVAGVLAVFLTHNVLQRRLAEERLATTRKLGELDARLLATTQEALAEQRKAASEREVLLREVYHRVKNNLQIVQSLVRLGSRDLAPGQREPFENAVRRIGAMARVHTLLYSSPDLASIDFKDYLEGLLRELADAYGAEERGIETVLEASPVRVPLDTAVPLAFIAVELLTNAYKHAFPDGRGGMVRIALFEEGEQGVLAIADDGVGVPEAPAGARRPLGLVIVGKLVQQIGGTLTEPETGRSEYRLVFPLQIDTPATPLPTPKVGMAGT